MDAKPKLMYQNIRVSPLGFQYVFVFTNIYDRSPFMLWKKGYRLSTYLYVYAPLLLRAYTKMTNRLAQICKYAHNKDGQASAMRL